MGLGMLISLPSMILVSLAVLAVPALAVVWGARGVGLLAGQRAASVVPPSAACPRCHRSLQPGWQHCAYCGQRLA
jgi:hypothetical protein